MKVTINKIILLSIVLLAFGACTSKKQLVKSEIPTEMTPAAMVAKLQDKQPAFSSANIKKMTVDVDMKERRMTVNATCKMVTDSAIHLSIQPFFGIELFKLELTPWNIVLIDKTNKTYYEAQYTQLRSRLGLDFDYKSIQSVISNRLFVSGIKTFLADDYKWKDNDVKSGILTVQGERMNQEIMVDAALDRIIGLVLKTNDGSYTLKTEYSGFKNFDKQLFPEMINMEAFNGESKASLYFKIEDVEFDKPLVLEAANLRRYQRGNLARFFIK